jgi:protein-L-isoaspartate(D-aspartate) O-methyltransferase
VAVLGSSVKRAINMPVVKTLISASALLFMVAVCGAQDDHYEQKRREMVARQIEARGISDRRVLDAMEEVPRHLFVPEELRYAAYEDTPLPIGYDQTISQPYIVAYMTEAAGLEPGDVVLEIGTGSGYQAAVLAKIVQEVYTIEIIRPLADSAGRRLEEMGIKNVHVRWGDGYAGWPEAAPFDAIIVTAAPPDIPQTLVEQLKVGGKMVVPVGAFFQQIYLITRTESGTDKKAMIPVRFVPMVRGGNTD